MLYSAHVVRPRNASGLAESLFLKAALPLSSSILGSKRRKLTWGTTKYSRYADCLPPYFFLLLHLFASVLQCDPFQQRHFHWKAAATIAVHFVRESVLQHEEANARKYTRKHTRALRRLNVFVASVLLCTTLVRGWAICDVLRRRIRFNIFHHEIQPHQQRCRPCREPVDHSPVRELILRNQLLFLRLLVAYFDKLAAEFDTAAISSLNLRFLSTPPLVDICRVFYVAPLLRCQW